MPSARFNGMASHPAIIGTKDEATADAFSSAQGHEEPDADEHRRGGLKDGFSSTVAMGLQDAYGLIGERRRGRRTA